MVAEYVCPSKLKTHFMLMLYCCWESLLSAKQRFLHAVSFFLLKSIKGLQHDVFPEEKCLLGLTKKLAFFFLPLHIASLMTD